MTTSKTLIQVFTAAILVGCSGANFHGQGGSSGAKLDGQGTPGQGSDASGKNGPGGNNGPGGSGGPGSGPGGSGGPNGPGGPGSGPGGSGTSASTPPVSCDALLKAGVVDTKTGMLFKLLPEKKSYDDGVAACQAMSGKMIYGGQEVGDEVLRCETDLGLLWMRPSDTATLYFNVPTNAPVSDRKNLNWILCYMPK